MGVHVNAQYADRSHYLVDSLILEELPPNDIILLDSALILYHKAAHDTDRLNALVILCEFMMHDSWHKYQFLQYKLINQYLEAAPSTALKKQYLGAMSYALNNIGYIYHHAKGNMPKALEFYQKSLLADEESANRSGIATSLSNIGVIYEDQGDVVRALEYYHEGLIIYEEIDDKNGVAISLNNLGLAYQNQEDLPKALEYFQKSLIIRREIDWKEGIGTALNNLGLLYKRHGDPECKGSKAECLESGAQKALDHYSRSLKIAEEIGDKQGEATALNNLGGVYKMQGNIPEALEVSLQGLKIREDIGDKKGVVYSLCNIGDLYLEMRDMDKAKRNAQNSLEYAQELGFPGQIRNAANLLSGIFKKENNFREALEMYELFIQMRDSINNEKTQKATIRQQTKYEFEKEQLVKEQKEKELARIESEKTSRRDNLQYSVILIAILVLFGGILFLRVINVSERMAEGIIFFSFLILFEFLLVLADPYIEGWSGGAPGIKLLFNAGIAALIFPMHAFFEAKLKGRLVK